MSRKTTQVVIGFFEGGAKCRISATTDAAILSAVSEMNRIIRPASLSETVNQHVTFSATQRFNESGSCTRDLFSRLPYNKSRSLL